MGKNLKTQKRKTHAIVSAGGESFQSTLSPQTPPGPPTGFGSVLPVVGRFCRFWVGFYGVLSILAVFAGRAPRGFLTGYG